MKKRKLILAASLALCLAAASCSDANANSTPSGNTPSENVPSESVKPSTNPSTSTTPGTTPGTKPSEEGSIKEQFNCISIKEALKKAKDAGSKYTSEQFYVYGKITKMVHETYGNMVITDGTDELFYYGTSDTNGNRYDAMPDKPTVGDEVVIKSILGEYDKKPQGKEGIIVAFKHAGGDDTEESNPNKPTVKPTENPNLSDDINAYYQDAHGTKGELKQSLHDIISVRNNTSYDTLWSTYKKVDVKPDGTIMDIYSNISKFKPGSDQAGNYSGEADKYNREHTIPKSWWGGNKTNQGADPFIVLPSDGWVNGMRSNYAFGEVKNITKHSANNYSILGSSKYGGPSTVFEPADEWKGDMARIYFYATTCYYTDNWRNGDGSYIFTASGNFGLTDYASKLFLKWHFEDPVSDWEMHRNNGIYKINGNRNPYVDHPEFVEQIWGSTTF